MLPADTFFFVSSSHAATSWLDRVLTTTSSHALVDSMQVKSTFISSDQLPLCFTISIDSEIVCTPVSVDRITDDVPSFNWKDITDNEIINCNLCTK